MKIVCCYLELNPVTEFCLRYQKDNRRFEVDYVNLSEDRENGYWKALAHYWSLGEGFIHIEPDVIPWPGALEEIEACHELLCNFWAPTGWNGHKYVLGYGTGLTKFSTELIRQLPTFMSDMVNSDFGTTYRHIDGQVLEGLEQKGIAQHFHNPPVTHYNPSRYPDSR